MINFILGCLTGMGVCLLIYHLWSSRWSPSRLKRYLPWIKPAPVISVDFKAKRRIK